MAIDDNKYTGPKSSSRRKFLKGGALTLAGAAAGAGALYEAERSHVDIGGEGGQTSINFGFNRKTMAADIQSLNEQQAKAALTAIVNGVQTDTSVVRDAIQNARGKTGRQAGS